MPFLQPSIAKPNEVVEGSLLMIARLWDPDG